MKRSMLYGLRGTILKYMAATSIVPLVIALVILYIVSRSALLSMAKQTMKNSANNIVKMCEIQSSEIDRKLEDDLERAWSAARATFAPYSSLSLSGDRQKLAVTNQDTLEKKTFEMPALLSAGAPVLRNHSIPDAVAGRIGLKGATSTVFQLHEGRLVRLATNVKDTKGERAILTYIPVDSRVSRTIASGKSFRGRAVVMGTWSLTHYEPLTDGRGKVIGALYIGIPAPRTVVFDMIKEARIADKGYIYVANSLGHVIEHPYWKGKSLYRMIDRRSGKRLSEVINSSHNDFFQYEIPGNDNSYSKKIAYVAPYKPWDWNIVVTAEYNDLLSSLNTVFLILVVFLVVFPAVLLFVANLMAMRLANPFRRIIETAQKVTQGDLGVFIPQTHYVKCTKMKNCSKQDCPAHSSRNLACWSIEGTVLDADGKPLPENEKIEKHCSGCAVYKNAIRSEIDELIEAINRMIVTLQQIIRDIKDTAGELHADADKLALTSLSLEEESQNQAGSIEETTSSHEELVATIENVSNASKHQAEKMAATRAAMEKLTAATRTVGQNSINLSREAARMVEEARETESMLQNTTTNIGQIEESSRKIGDIIAMINDISDQINLLSLNAAIESARAGEHGKGFAVVAEEISKLAEATANSTKEIETLIKTSRTDIGAGADLVNHTAEGITAMIKKIEMAAKMMESIARASEEQMKSSEQVMADVEEVNRMSLQIAQANDEQKQTSAEILQAVSQINESLQSVAGASINISYSAAAMKERATRLFDLTSRFRVRK